MFTKFLKYEFAPLIFGWCIKSVDPPVISLIKAFRRFTPKTVTLKLSVAINNEGNSLESLKGVN